MEVRLTTRMIETAVAPTTGSLWLRDTQQHGLSVRVWRAGRGIRRAYVLSWPDGHGGTFTATLGHHGGPWRPDPDTGAARVLTLELARQEAVRLLGGRVDGKDPAAARDAPPGKPTLRAFAPRYRERWSTVEKAPRTVAEEDGLLKRHLLPLLGDERMEAIGPRHVSALKAALRGHPVTANRCRSLLSCMLNVARAWGDVPAPFVNPCPMVPPYAERGRERTLSVEEMRALGPALVAEEKTAPVAVAALRTLMLVGARPIEILTLKRAQLEVGLVTGVIVQESRKSKHRRRPLYLNPLAIAVLAAAPAVEGNEYVFPGEVPGRPLTHSGLGAAWERICRRARIQNARPYDLRHSFVTISTMQRAATNRKLVQDLAGHADPRTTEKYIHLPPEPLRALSEETSTAIEKALRGG